LFPIDKHDLYRAWLTTDRFLADRSSAEQPLPEREHDERV